MKIEVSNGEIVDKITILRIKESKIQDETKLANVKKELDELLPSLQLMGLKEESESFINLLEVNQKLWQIEDDIRDKERAKEFDEEFIEIARAVYRVNDQRCVLKKQINIDTSSTLVEEKSYAEME